MQNEIVWGNSERSAITATETGHCIDYTYENGLSYAPPNYNLGVAEWELLGHKVRVDFGFFDTPDVFSVTPLTGWEVITENFVVVGEWTKATITVCQMLLG